MGKRSRVLERRSAFDPHVAGTLPLDRPEGDIDILCQWTGAGSAIAAAAVTRWLRSILGWPAFRRNAFAGGADQRVVEDQRGMVAPQRFG